MDEQIKSLTNWCSFAAHLSKLAHDGWTDGWSGRKHAREAVSVTVAEDVAEDMRIETVKRYFMEMQRDKDELDEPASNQHRAAPSLHAQTHKRTPIGDNGLSCLRVLLDPRVRPRPSLRKLRSIRIQYLSSRQVPNGSCRLAHGCRGKQRRWAYSHHFTPHGLRPMGVGYIASYGDSFIFHFFSPDLAGVPDLVLISVCSRHLEQGSGSLAGSGHAGSSYETSLSISLRRCNAAAARPPARNYLAVRL